MSKTHIPRLSEFCPLLFQCNDCIIHRISSLDFVILSFLQLFLLSYSFLLDNQWVFIYYFNVDAINVHIVAWLSLVERCVRDAEVASSNLVATTKNTPSHMCEGVFLFLQLFKLTTSNWFRTHRSGAEGPRGPGTSAWTDRSGAKTHEVQGTSAWTDRSGAETPRGPGDLGLDRAERRPQINFH